MVPHDIDPRLLRAFLAVAEELHFSRAAARLHLAQQALSRDIARLERQLGAALFLRTTRRVELTEAGERLLPYARRLAEAQEALLAAFAPDAERPLLVDIRAQAATGNRVLEEARRASPETELTARFHSGLTGAADEILAGRLDVSFGRVAGLSAAARSGLEHRLIRYEAMAVLLPEDHPLAALPAIPLDRLAGETLYTGAGNPATAEWTALAEQLFAARGIRSAAPFPSIDGEREFARLMRKQGWSVLATTQFLTLDGTVLRPLTDPVPLAAVSLVWRRGLRHPGLDALLSAAAGLAGRYGWLARPPGSWLPDLDARLAGGESADR